MNVILKKFLVRQGSTVQRMDVPQGIGAPEVLIQYLVRQGVIVPVDRVRLRDVLQEVIVVARVEDLVEALAVDLALVEAELQVIPPVQKDITVPAER